jgi:hypothetical protein
LAFGAIIQPRGRERRTTESSNASSTLCVV